MRCKYEEATWGSKITKTLKLDVINRQHSERNACYGDNSVTQLPADFVFLQFSNPDGSVINRMSPLTTSCFFDLKDTRVWPPREFPTILHASQLMTGTEHLLVVKSGPSNGHAMLDGKGVGGLTKDKCYVTVAARYAETFETKT
jgi:hypothetical protein